VGRRLGQHFLFDPSILDRIVDALEPSPDDVVIEIGAGQGTLTRRLASRVGRVVAIERDRALADLLLGRESGIGNRESSPPLPLNVTVLSGDALRLDWIELATEPTIPDSRFPIPVKITGNIPYAITSPLIDKALSSPLPSVIVFLVQREVAERLVAAPGTKQYGALTVGVAVTAVVERLFTVKAGAFRPPPRVESAVVRIRPRATPLVAADRQAAFRRFTVALFGQRRKQLGTALRHLTDRDAAGVASVLDALGLDRRVRAEELEPGVLVRLFEEVGEGLGRMGKDGEG